MDLGWGFIYFMLALITLRFAWDTPARWLALALVANTTLSNMFGVLAPPDAAPAVNVMLSLGMIVVAGFSLCTVPAISVVIITLSTTQCLLGIAFSAVGDMEQLNLYEERANAIFATKCVTVLLIGLWNVVGDNVRRWWHWRSLRRHASNAAHRVRMDARRRR